jgi:RecA-family ATPase
MADQPIPSELFDPITFNECMNIAKDLVVPKMLFSEFWYEGEVSILFANTNLGKSILAVQIGDSISSGRPIDGLKMEAEKRRVLYFDFELSLKQLEARYSQNYTNHYRFDDDFIRVTLLSDLSFPDSIDFEDYLCQELENLAAEMKAKVLIIDNLTHLKNETERAKDALPLMKRLKNMANRHGLSILVIAHTPKRDAARPLSNNDLQGSKMLSNFCDSAFAIGKNLKDKHLRYIKQVKQRMTAELYDGENVFVCELTKGEHDNFTGFKFLEMGYEYEHLRQFDEISKEERNPLILKMHKERKSSRVIGEEIGLSHTAVQKILDKLRKT